MIQTHFTKIKKIKNKFSKFNNKEIDHVLQALNSENKMREAILNGTDPKEAYLKYGKF